MAATIVEFITARLDEAEATAREVASSYGAVWYSHSEGVYDTETGGRVVNGTWGVLEDHLGAHIVAHDPAAVLRDVEAMRRIVAMYEEEQRESHRDTLQDVVHELASRWPNHPDYRPAWRP